ncbi:hypothetical protein A6P39_028115 [Streptomyces sp. FXJ1.172]|uniref:hypothetical protein n=1 Tax=Streptomyces sp. FXJ1.172 TaxID=710705 RepID=UPI0007CF089B|nr:hypothetical protein [Streptomyces sp. FXJ1.172]WEO97573.1 hypothetical protein A6P39_028115 [Streptomyces sp. FXJ1.172]
MTKRTITAIVAAVLVAAVGVTVAVLRGGKDSGTAAQRSSFCWGTLKHTDVAALSVRPLRRYASDEGDLKGSRRADCEVGAGLDSHGAMQEPQFRLSVGGTPVTSVWTMADAVAGVSAVRAPIAGVPGWVNRTMAGVLLPARCSGELGSGSAPYVRLEAEGGQDQAWQDGTLQRRMADVLMTAATGLARQLGCADAAFRAPGTAPRLLTKQAPAAGKACALPGFGAPAKYTEQYVTGGGFRLWSCTLGTGGGAEGDQAHLTVTQDPYLVALNATDPAAGSVTLKCGGRQTLVQTGTDDRELARGLRAALARAAGCS